MNIKVIFYTTFDSYHRFLGLAHLSNNKSSVCHFSVHLFQLCLLFSLKNNHKANIWERNPHILQKIIIYTATKSESSHLVCVQLGPHVLQMGFLQLLDLSAVHWFRYGMLFYHLSLKAHILHEQRPWVLQQQEPGHSLQMELLPYHYAAQRRSSRGAIGKWWIGKA